MFRITIDKGYAQTKAEQILVEAFKNPSKICRLKQVFDSNRKSALYMTAARLRKYMIEAFEKNSLNWPKHKRYSKWLGISGQSVSIDGLTAANRPKKTLTAKGNKRKRGYSRKSTIKPPKQTKVGGKYRIKYKVDKNNFEVGLIDASSKWKRRFQIFQDGGIVQPEKGTSARTRRYFAAIGIPIRKYHVFKAPPRPLIGPIQEKYPPKKLFEVAFIEKMEGRK